MSNRSLNLIPPATRRRRILRRAFRLWVKSTLVAGVAVGLLLGTEWLRGVAVLRELGELKGRCVPIERLMQETASISEQVKQLATREQLTLRLARDDRGIAVLAALSLATSGGQGDVYLEAMQYEVIDDAPVLRIEGAGIDGSAVAGFVERLKKTGVFWNVVIDSSAPLGGGETGSLRRFDLACKI